MFASICHYDSSFSLKSIRGAPKNHLAAKDWPEFVVQFNTYKISGDDPMSLTSFLHENNNARIYLHNYKIYR